MRDWPTAKSAMSIISCTSPSPSALILPISSETRLPRSDLCRRSSSPTRRTASPRFGAGTVRQASATSRAAAITCSYCAGVVASTLRDDLAGGGIHRIDARRRRIRRASRRSTTRCRVEGLEAEVCEYVVHHVHLHWPRAAGRSGRRRPCGPRLPWCRRRRSAGRSGCRARRPGGSPPGARSRGSGPACCSTRSTTARDAGGRRDLDRRPEPARDHLRVDLADVVLLAQLAVLPAGDRDVDDHDVLQRLRHGVLEDALQRGAVLVQLEVVHQQAHLRAVPGIADGLVVHALGALRRRCRRASRARPRC